MSVLPFPTNLPARREEIAKQLRHIADAIESGGAFYDHHAFLMCLTSPTHHECLAFGYSNDREGWRGAHAALDAIMHSNYRTEGGNIRARSAPRYGPPNDTPPINLADAAAIRVRALEEEGR